MKQVLLRITAVFAKIAFGKFTQPLRGDLLLVREITLFQDPLDPDVDGECAQALVGKQHYAVGYLRSHAGQRAELFSKIEIRKSRP